MAFRGYGDNHYSTGRNSQRSVQDRLAGFTHDGDHGSFIGEVLSDIPYVKRIPETTSVVHRPRKKGVVGPEVDYSVRTSYIPVGLFHTLLRWLGKQKTYQIFSGASQLRTEYTRIESARRRPPKGFMSMNLNWTDDQCKNWTKLANKLGIQYKGDQYYIVPEKCLGHWRGGTHYVGPAPSKWADIGSLIRIDIPLKVRHKRSEVSRIRRKFQRFRKEFAVRPIPLDSVLTVRKIYSRKQIGKMYDFSVPISQFRDSIPNCLSIAFGPPAQVSQLVLDSLRRIYSRPKKFLEDLSWLIPKGKEPTVKLVMKVPPPEKVRKKFARLIVMVTSSQHGTFYAMHTTGHGLHVTENQIPRLTNQEKESVRNKMFEWQKKLDENPGDYQPGQVLGGWFD